MIGGSEHIRYCGSPISLSFDETGKAKSVHLVTFTAGKLSAVDTLDVPVTQPLAVLKGDWRPSPLSLSSGVVRRKHRRSGWTSKSPPMNICMICSVKFRR
jgi:hypothetical protein